jgi:hypothetical protein
MSALFLIVSCNTDNDGIFLQVSKSEEKTDVGSIILLNKVGTTFYARTRQHQLQTYDSANRKWTLIDDAKATHATAAANNIYYAASVKEVEGNHEIKNLNDPNDSNKDFKIVAMDPLNDLMLVENSDGKFDIHRVSTKNKIGNNIENLEFYNDYTPQLITQSSGLFVVSGKTASDKYTHHLYDNGDEKVISDINAPVVAMLKAGDNVVLLTSKNEIYTSSDSGTTFTKSDKIVPNFPTTRRPAGAPYPAFVYNDKLYLQNRHNYLYTIDSSGEVKADDDIDLVAVKGWSYLVKGGIVYVGTSQNGIYEINMVTKKVTAL